MMQTKIQFVITTISCTNGAKFYLCDFFCMQGNNMGHMADLTSFISFAVDSVFLVSYPDTRWRKRISSGRYISADNVHKNHRQFGFSNSTSQNIIFLFIILCLLLPKYSTWTMNCKTILILGKLSFTKSTLMQNN